MTRLLAVTALFALVALAFAVVVLLRDDGRVPLASLVMLTLLLALTLVLPLALRGDE